MVMNLYFEAASVCVGHYDPYTLSLPYERLKYEYWTLIKMITYWGGGRGHLHSLILRRFDAKSTHHLNSVGVLTR